MFDKEPIMVEDLVPEYPVQQPRVVLIQIVIHPDGTIERTV